MAPGIESDLPNDTISFLPLTEATTSAKRQRSTISTGILTYAPLPTLPIDLIVEILYMLPMKFLRQLRCICKSWNALISDPTFRMEYDRLSITHHLIRLSFRSTLKMFLSDLSTLSYDDTETQLTYPNRLKNKYGTLLCMLSRDGFLCFVTKISYVILWNPSMRAFKILPPLKNLRERKYISSSYSFGYDPFIDDYKIVAIYFFKDKVEVNIYIYTIGKSWRRIQEFPRCSSICGPGVFVDGTVNWLTFYDSSSTSCAIVSLDLEKESYQTLSQPDLEKNHNWTLGVLENCLCIYASSDTFFDVWIMKEYGNKESWTKLHHIPCMRGQDLSRTLYISKDDQILMDFYYDPEESFKLELVVYDCKKNTFKVLKEFENQ
ncbi:F-box/kelch-repeat protein At3g23880-like [Trifolium pratense]|uniref:Uncharacterized protein n=1 Tax=Trifolium pratense TaxID=57577 RepID=A0ACB0J206_TRIPR|nr:F-box/kelch-repeat protein At3g23880-like [Trifolium pratense]CAJ2638482.1 unnamed protein product [Trifolium pratense]